MAAKASGSLGTIGPVPAAEPVLCVASACAVLDFSDEICGVEKDSLIGLNGFSLVVNIWPFDPFFAELDSDFFGMVVSGTVSV